MAKPLRLRIRKTLPLMSFTLPFTLISIIIFINTAKASDAISASDSSSHHWTPSKQRDGISSYTRDVANSKYKAVKGVTTLPVSTARLFAAINDAPACPEWADTCKESYVQQAVSAHEFFIYTLNDLPWPVKNRDVLAHVTWTHLSYQRKPPGLEKAAQ